MRDDPSRRPYDGSPDDLHNDDTQAIRRDRVLRPEPDLIEERYVEPVPYVDPAPPVRDRYVEERYVERPRVQEEVVETRTTRARADSLARYARIIYFVFGVIESLIAIRAVLRLLGARETGFASFIYGITGPFVAPFQGLFNEPDFGSSVIELSSLLAIIVYALLAYALVRLLYIFSD